MLDYLFFLNATENILVSVVMASFFALDERVRVVNCYTPPL